MVDRPILFSAPMVRALLAGTKTQTRRVIEPYSPQIDPSFWPKADPRNLVVVKTRSRDGRKWVAGPAFAPRISIGDRLWVRETYTTTQHGKAVYRADARDQTGARWSSITAGDPKGEVKWKPSIFMPRALSRLTLTVTDVRVQRLQDISEADAIAEGIEKVFYDGDRPEYFDQFGWKDYRDHPYAIAPFVSPDRSYSTLWDSINGPGAWDANPWVAAYSFTVEHRNIDAAPRAA